MWIIILCKCNYFLVKVFIRNYVKANNIDCKNEL